MFGIVTDHTLRGLITEIRDLRKELARLEGYKDALKGEVAYTKEALALKREIEDLKINKARMMEEHAKEDRELRHMIGLEKKRQEFEVEQAKKETVVTVREENLVAEKLRFAEQVAFHAERFEKEVGYLKEILGDILKRLPTVNVDRKAK